MAEASKARWLNRTVLAIGLASLFSDVGHEMATAAMPGLLATIGAGSATLGLLEGFSDAASTFAKLLSGAYSDRLEKRKPLAVVGYFVTAAGMASFALATQAWHVFVGRSIGWIGRGVRGPVRDVLLTDATTKETAGKAFGLERAMDSAGAVIGPLGALALVAAVGLRWTFAFTFVPGILAWLCITSVKEKEHPPADRRRSLFAGARELPKAFKRFLIGVGVAGTGDFSNTLLILWATEAWKPRFGTERAAAIAIGFYAGYNVVYTIACWVAGVLADKMPKGRVLAFGYAFTAVPAALLLLPGDSFVKFGAVFALSGLYMGFRETVEKATAATYVASNIKGTAFGVLASVNGVGDLVSSALVGVLWALHPTMAMSFVIATSLAGAILVATAGKSEPAEPSS